jgi:gas vesicle protein
MWSIKMKRISRFIFGAMIGGFIGSTIVILLAPESGEETRTALSSRLENLVKQIRTAVEERKEELIKEIDNYKNSAF